MPRRSNNFDVRCRARIRSARTSSRTRTRSLAACVTADMPETTRVALTVMGWWPEIEMFLELGITNARTEGVKAA